MTVNIDILITDLEREISELEHDKNPSYPVSKSDVWELDALEQQASFRPYTLDTEQMQLVSQIYPVFEQQVQSLSYAELEDMLITAQKKQDAAKMWLLSKYAPSNMIRAQAKSLGADTDTLNKVARAKHLAARLRMLQSMSPLEQEQLASQLGHTASSTAVQAQSKDTRLQERVEQLLASGEYSF